MGIETALLALGASAGTAATVGTIGSVLGAVGTIGQVAGLAKGQKAPKVDQVQTPDTPKTQEAKTPDRNASLNANAAAATGAQAGNSSTFLTGPSGVDPLQLLLGKSALLGE